MFYTIYQITNNVNGKIYIGKHQSKDLNDGYMGSGKRLRRAMSKYGIENFTKEILFQFDNEEAMNAKEAELVTEEFCLREDTYNLCPGGQGGFGYINSNGLAGKNTKGFLGKTHSEETKETLRRREIHWGGKISKSKKGKRPWNFGKQLSFDDRKNKSNSQKGSRNSQYGTFWITNGIESKKVNSEEFIPEGWYRGRKTQ